MTEKEAQTAIENRLGKLIDAIPNINAKQRLFILELLLYNASEVIKVLETHKELEAVVQS